MSGYGRGVALGRGLEVTCEIRTVNHRYLDLALSLPGPMLALEPALRKWLAKCLSRGRVEVSVSLTTARRSGAAPSLNEGLARWYGGKLLKLAKTMNLPPPGVEALAQFPGVITWGETSPTPGRRSKLLRQAVERALHRVRAMRRREGAALAADLMRRLKTVERGVAWLLLEWPRSQWRQRGKTEARLSAILKRLGEEKKDSSLRELLGVLERGDVTEELTRLCSHLAQYRTALHQGSPVGRKLDYLAQEIQREVHTIGAKTGDALIARKVVEMKEAVERIREQVQNLE